MINKKIDPLLFNFVDTLSNEMKKVDCLVYVSNFKLAKNFLLSFNNQLFEYPFINAFGMQLLITDINKLANFKHINYITAEAKVFAQMNVAKKVVNFNAELKETYTGKNVTMAVIDTGVNAHLDFVFPKNRIVLFKDFINNHTKPYDDNGHGTFICGVIAGNGVLSGGKYSGIAPNSNFICLKALDKNGETGAFNILQAMQWIYDNYKKYNIRVVCMSFGSQPLKNGDPLLLGAEALWNLGVVVVAAAGNSGPFFRTIKSPGTSNKIITVGALNDKRENDDTFKPENFEIAEFSSRGPVNNYFKPDCVAPGVDIFSTGITADYVKMSGTSVATPIIAGLCALLIEKYPQIKPMELKYFLIRNCQKIVNDRNIEGFGLINFSKILS